MKSILIGLAITSSLFVSSIQAAEGDIDVSYGQQGYARVDARDLLGGDATYEPPISLRGPGNRMYLVGSMRFSGLERSYIARVQPDGSLDSSFANGAGITSIGSPNADFEGRAAVVAADGGVVIAGLRTVQGNIRPMVCKLTAAGELDGVGFGDPQTPGCRVLPWPAKFTGMVLPAIGFNLIPMSSAAIARTSDDGYVLAFRQDDNNLAIARLNEAGSIDIGFGNGVGPDEGLFTIDTNIGVGQIAVKPDGSIIVTGFEFSTLIDTNILVVQVGSTGQEILGVHTATIDLHPQFSLDVPTALAVHPNGEVVVAGFAEAGESGHAAVLLRLDENLDPVVPTGAQFPGPAYDANRQAFVACDACAIQYVSDIAFLSNGGLMLVGSYGLDIFDSNVYAMRLTPEWELDGEFGGLGQTDINFDVFDDIQSTYDNAPSITLQCGERPVVVARRGDNGADSTIGLTRLLNDSIYCDGFDD